MKSGARLEISRRPFLAGSLSVATAYLTPAAFGWSEAGKRNPGLRKHRRPDEVTSSKLLNMERETGIEPATFSLGS
jgi:hypothetical protein